MIPCNNDLKATARTSLAGHFFPIVMAVLSAEMIMWLCGTFLNGPSRTVLGWLTSMALSLVLSILLLVIDAGFHYMYLQLARHRQIRVMDMFHCFRWQSNTAITLSIFLCLLNLAASLPLLLPSIVVPAVFTSIPATVLLVIVYIGISGSLNIIYSMVFFILMDTPNLTPVQIMKKSRCLTRGYRIRLAGLVISMIGYVLLGIISLGIGLLWVGPYIGTTLAHFYLSCVDRKEM